MAGMLKGSSALAPGEGRRRERATCNKPRTIITNLTNYFQRKIKQQIFETSKTSSFYNKQAKSINIHTLLKLEQNERKTQSKAKPMQFGGNLVERTLFLENIAVNSSLGRE